MKLTGIRARNFMSFQGLNLELDGRSVVVTGPNGAGKSNIGRIVDVTRAVLASYAGHASRERLDLYTQAGRLGSHSFSVSLSIELDQQWERELISTFIRAAYVCSTDTTKPETKFSRTVRDYDAKKRLNVASLNPLMSGQLKIAYDAASRQPWSANWDFEVDDGGRHPEPWSIELLSGSRMTPVWGAEPYSVALGDAWQRAFPDQDIKKSRRSDQKPPLDFQQILELKEPISLQASVPNDGSAVPDSVLELGAILEIPDIDTKTFSFLHIMSFLLQRSLVLTDNRRLPLQRHFDLHSLREAADLQDGSQVPGELYRLKNGTLEQRKRYAEIRKLFQSLVGSPFEVQAVPDAGNPSGLLIDVTLPEGELEYPIAFSGAGRQEALVLSTLLAGDPGRVIVLDEPAVHIETTLQRRLVHSFDGRAQCIVITHSPDLVPISKPEDLKRITRLAPGTKGSQLCRIKNEVEDPNKQARWLQRLGTGDARSLLFAAGVILCEGATEVGALGAWLEGIQEPNWIPPSGDNIAIVDVGGEGGFGIYIDFLDAFEIPWVIVADGPALRSGSKLFEPMKDSGLLPDNSPDDINDFAAWKAYWANIGIYSLADAFGDDGSKSGEFEEFLKGLDGKLYDRLGNEIGRRSKPRIGAAFAAQHAIPDEIKKMYLQMKIHLLPLRP